MGLEGFFTGMGLAGKKVAQPELNVGCRTGQAILTRGS